MIGEAGGGRDCGVYVDGIRQPDESTHAVALNRVRELGRGFVWLNLEEPDDGHVHSAAAVFDLHPLAAEDALLTRRRSKLARYNDISVVVLKTFRQPGSDGEPLTRHDVASAQIAVVVGYDFVITRSQGEHPAVAAVRRQMDGSSDARGWVPHTVMHAIARRVVDGYLEVADQMRAEADLIEEDVFSRSLGSDIERIYVLKREIARMHMSIAPLTLELRQFAADHDDQISIEFRRSIRDVMERNIHAAERLAVCDELLGALLESAYGRQDTQQNVDMRKIAAWAAMGVVPTTVSGIYGMRFAAIPELHWAWGYPAVLTLMVLVTAILYRTFRRKRWL